MSVAEISINSFIVWFWRKLGLFNKSAPTHVAISIIVKRIWKHSATIKNLKASSNDLFCEIDAIVSLILNVRYGLEILLRITRQNSLPHVFLIYDCLFVEALKSVHKEYLSNKTSNARISLSDNLSIFTTLYPSPKTSSISSKITSWRDLRSDVIIHICFE